MAENPLVTLFEARALFGSPLALGQVVPHPNRPLVTLPIIVSLSSVADLSDPLEAAKIETNAQELTGDWRSYAARTAPGPHSGLPPTHVLGNALYSIGSHQGLISFSATLPDYKILAVFTNRLNNRAADYLQYSFHDELGAMHIKRIP